MSKSIESMSADELLDEFYDQSVAASFDVPNSLDRVREEVIKRIKND